MVFRLIDKLLFSALLLVSLQIPQLADHYQQFLAGNLDATQWQVDGYNTTAKEHGYNDALAMINHHLDNNVASVKADARQKLSTLETLDTLKQGIVIFEQGNLLEKTAYIFTPSRLDTLQKTLVNFVPGIPLSLEGWTFGLITGLLLNGFILMPFWWIGRVRRRKASTQTTKKASTNHIRVEPTFR